MKLGYFDCPKEGVSFYGVMQGDCVTRIESYENQSPLQSYPLTELRILCPSQPSKIVAVGLNYREHASELNMKLPEEPILFLKPPTAALAHGEFIISPPMSQRVDYEAELGLVIKKTAKNISVAEAPEYILGYTAFNDVTARDIQSKDGQWTRAKGFDTFAPFGPWIETEIENPDYLRIQALLNERVVQDSNTMDMIFPVFYLVSFISHVMTLHAGDVIATGTPPGIGKMDKGDKIVIRIEGLDDLCNFLS